MIARLLILAATVGGGLLVGRKLVNAEIERRLPREIEIAEERAKAELRREIGAVIVDRLVSFALNLATKAALVALAYLAYRAGLYGRDAFRIAIAVLIALFILRDALVTLPFVAPAWRHARQHRFRPRTMVIELVAGAAFEKAYAEAMLAMEQGPGRRWLAMSRYSAEALSREVGEAVADVARSANYRGAAWRAGLAVGGAAAMFAAYSAFLFVTLG